MEEGILEVYGGCPIPGVEQANHVWNTLHAEVRRVEAGLVERLEVDNRPHAAVLLGDQEQMGDLTWGLGVHCMNSPLLEERLHLFIDETSLLLSEVGATNLAGRRGGEGGKVKI